MSILPLSKTQIESICVVQRKMLRRIVGWRRIGDEPWRDTMTRMRERVSRAMDLHHIDDWNLSFSHQGGGERQLTNEKQTEDEKKRSQAPAHLRGGSTFHII